MNNPDYVNGFRPSGVNSTVFSVGWTGYIVPPVTGNYVFTTVSDDGVTLSMNGTTIINNFTDHASTTNNSSSIYLIAGQAYPVSMQYYQNTGYAVAQLEWSYPGQTTQIIPSSSLFTPALPANSLSGTGSSLSFTNITAGGTYGVFATNATNSCMSIMSGNASITNSVNQYYVSGSGTFCGSSSILLSNSDIGVIYQVQVSGINYGSSVAGTGASINFPVTASGTYTVIATNSSTGCQNTMIGSATLTVSPNPTSYNLGGMSHYCSSGSGTTLTLSGSQSGVNYQLLSGFQSGLSAQYYNNMTLTGSPVVTEIDGNINHPDFVASTRPSGVNSTQFSVNWSGFLQIPVSGNYTFTTVSDDGIRLWVNGNEVINDWNDHSQTNDNSPSMYFTAGQYISIQCQYYQNGGGAVAELEWTYPGQTIQIIPSTQFYTYSTLGSSTPGTGNPLSFTNITSGTYSLLATNASSSCSGIMNGSITVVADAAPSNSVAGSDQTLSCSNSTLTLAGNNPSVGTGLWTQVSGPNTAVFTSASTYNSTVTGLSTGTYVFTWTITNGTCTSSSNVNIIVPNGLNPYTLTGGGSFCSGTTATLSLSGSDFGNTYQLLNGGVNSGSPQNGNGSGLVFNTNNAGTYTVLATNTSTGCSQVMIGAPVLTSTNCSAQGGIIIPGGGYFIQSSNYILNAGNFVNNGNFNATGGTFTFNGGIQSISGTSSGNFQSLTIAIGSTTTVSSGSQFIAGVLTSNGSLVTGGYITLLASASQTALINGAETGTISGNIIMQGYLSSKFGYKYLGSPFTSTTVGQFSGPVNLSSSFPSFYSYNERNPATGWVTDTTSTHSLVPGLGYAMNFGSATGSLTLSLQGIVNNGTITQTLYNHNNTYTQGFNLVSNPYPSPIDWNSSTG